MTSICPSSSYVDVFTHVKTKSRGFAELQIDLAVATPLRLSKVAKRTDLSSVSYLILDEADKLFEEGLVKQIDRVIGACTNPRLVRCPSLHRAAFHDLTSLHRVASREKAVTWTVQVRSVSEWRMNG